MWNEVESNVRYCISLNCICRVRVASEEGVALWNGWRGRSGRGRARGPGWVLGALVFAAVSFSHRKLRSGICALTICQQHLGYEKAEAKDTVRNDTPYSIGIKHVCVLCCTTSKTRLVLGPTETNKCCSC